MSVLAFCERHNMSNMLNLLRSSGPATHMQEVFALNVLEELLAGDADKLEALRSIRAEIHPVEKAAKLRALKKAQQNEINHKKEVIATLHKRISELEAQLEQKRKAQAQAAQGGAQHAQQAMPEDESQAVQDDETQILFGAAGNHSPDTQPDNMQAEQASILRKK